MFSNTQMDHEFCANVARIADALESKTLDDKQSTDDQLVLTMPDGMTASDMFYVIKDALRDAVDASNRYIDEDYDHNNDAPEDLVRNKAILAEQLKVYVNLKEAK